MATSFDTIIDNALLVIQDYKLNALSTTSQNDFKLITEGFLLRGLPEFKNCKTDLSYNLETSTFINTLSTMEIKILSDLWVEQWLLHQIQNLTQLQNKMTPTDFKHLSEAENLKQKSEYVDKIREKYRQEMTDYSYNNVNWINWGNGIF